MIIFATCATLLAAAVGALPGDTVRLSGDCPATTLQGPLPIMIDARGATMRGLVLDAVSGLTWRGGTLRASGGTNGVAGGSYAVQLRGGARLRISGAAITDAARGIVANAVASLRIDGNTFRGLRSDGINLIAGRDTVIDRNIMAGFTPLPTSCTTPQEVRSGLSAAACTAIGGTWRDGDHPDGIQMWGGATRVRIERNRIDGPVQGIGIFGPPAEPRSARVSVTGNALALGVPHGITLQQCDDCTIAGNEVIATAAAKTTIRFDGSTGCVRDNVVPATPRLVQECRR
jgi:nitrous oxidase accessory protein NosD